MTFVDPTEATRSGIEEVITSTIGNRVTAKNRPRVRIPPTPPKPRTFYVRGFLSFLDTDTNDPKCGNHITDRMPQVEVAFIATSTCSFYSPVGPLRAQPRAAFD